MPVRKLASRLADDDFPGEFTIIDAPPDDSGGQGGDGPIPIILPKWDSAASSDAVESPGTMVHGWMDGWMDECQPQG